MQGRGQGDQKLGRLFPLEPPCRAGHDRQIEADFPGPAPRKQADGQAVLGQPAGAQELSPGAGRLYPVHQGVAHVLHLHPMPPVELCFEGQNDDHPVHPLTQAMHPALAPSPDLGADEIEDAHTLSLELPGQGEVEVREVHQNGPAGPPLFRSRLELSQSGKKPAQMGNRFERTQHAQLAVVHLDLHPRLPQGRATAAEEVRSGGAQPGLQGPDQIGGVHVSGGLARHHQNGCCRTLRTGLHGKYPPPSDTMGWCAAATNGSLVTPPTASAFAGGSASVCNPYMVYTINRKHG